MPKAIVIQDKQLEHAASVANASSLYNSRRHAAAVLACFSTGITVTEIEAYA